MAMEEWWGGDYSRDSNDDIAFRETYDDLNAIIKVDCFYDPISEKVYASKKHVDCIHIQMQVTRELYQDIKRDGILMAIRDKVVDLHRSPNLMLMGNDLVTSTTPEPMVMTNLVTSSTQLVAQAAPEASSKYSFCSSNHLDFVTPPLDFSKT